MCPHTERERIRPLHIDRLPLQDDALKSYQLFLDLFLLTGKHVRILKEKYPDHHILTVDG